MKIPGFVSCLGAVVLVASCSTTGGSSGDWSRTYFAPHEKVIEAVIDVLEDEGYLVDPDREKGRITAEPSRSSDGLASMLVTVKRKDDRIVVDVQTRTGATFSTMTSRPTESAVLEFFHALDLRLQGGRS